MTDPSKTDAERPRSIFLPSSGTLSPDRSGSDGTLLSKQREIEIEVMNTLTPTDKMRFWINVHRTKKCWEWTGNKSKKGYPRFCPRKTISLYAHRFSYLLEHGSIPLELIICHKCNNRGCVNPNHLYAGTDLDNMLDRSKAETGWGTMLSERKVKFIRQSKLSHKELAKRYGVTPGAICSAAHGRTWSHIK